MYRKAYDEESLEVGASRSLNKMLRDLEAIAARREPDGAGPLRHKVHQAVYNLIQDVARRWYMKGFKRGHRTAFAKFREDDSAGFPKKISKHIRMRFHFSGDQALHVHLKSDLKRRKGSAKAEKHHR